MLSRPVFGASPGEIPRADSPLHIQASCPPAESRILKIIHSWPDDPGAQDALIRSLARQGFGGVVCNVSFTEYLESEARWKALGRAVEEAKKGFSRDCPVKIDWSERALRMEAGRACSAREA